MRKEPPEGPECRIVYAKRKTTADVQATAKTKLLCLEYQNHNRCRRAAKIADIAQYKAHRISRTWSKTVFEPVSSNVSVGKENGARFVVWRCRKLTNSNCRLANAGAPNGHDDARDLITFDAVVGEWSLDVGESM